MTLGALIESQRAGIEKRIARQMETVDAVYDEDLWSILEKYGMLTDLDAGKLACAVTGIALSRDNVGGILVTPNGPRLVANSFEAIARAG